MQNPATEPPKAMISYSWDDEAHKEWVRKLAARLCADGVNVTLDQWQLVPGDQLPKFMESAIRENSYVLLICTPNYKTKSDARTGGVGYEGDIMTAEVLTQGNTRKFIPIYRSGSRLDSMPSWLKGKFSIDLTGDPYSDDSYHDLLATLHNRREQAPPIGSPPPPRRSVRDEVARFAPTKEAMDGEFEPIKIEGVLLDEVGKPRNDGSPGCALYPVPFKLSRTPTHEWGQLFVRAWDRPTWSQMHRPGIARVQGDRIVLMGTTIEEVKSSHRDTLKLVVEVANNQVVELRRARLADQEAQQRRDEAHRDHIRKLGEDLSFD